MGGAQVASVMKPTDYREDREMPHFKILISFSVHYSPEYGYVTYD